MIDLHASRYWFAGPLCLNVFADVRPQASLGVHLCFVPLYVDLHALWFIVSLMSRARGLELQQADREQWPFVFGEDYD